LKNLKINWHISLAFVFGVILVFGFSPFRIWPLGLIVPAALFLLFYRKSPKQAFWIGFAFGMGEFGFGTSWVYVSLAHYGNGVVLAALITLLFTLLLALFPALQCWLTQKLFSLDYFAQNTSKRGGMERRPSDMRNEMSMMEVLHDLPKVRCSYRINKWQCLLVYPLLWLGFELIRSTLFTGFPWLLLGYTQTFSWLAGYAKLGSVFLVSWVTVFLSILILLCFKEKLWGKIISLFFIVAIVVGGWALRQHQFTHPLTEKPVQVALVQGNISENEKWQPGALPEILKTYADLTGPVLNTSLIVWPENSIPALPQDVMGFIDSLDNSTKALGSAVVFGIPIENTINKTYFNGALAMGDAKGMYLKQHLVPFGEYLPLPELFGPVFNLFHIPMSNFSPGPDHPYPLHIHGLSVRVFICYESAYPFLFRQAADAAYVITMSDDAWFGRSLGPYQHEEMEVMRAIETGRPILRATNTGVTSIIDQNGRVLKKAPMFTAFVLKGSIEPVTGETPWLRM